VIDKENEMTNTERLIASLDYAIKSGLPHLNFYVGKYTGNGPSVVAALRRRGYRVEPVMSSGGYRVFPK
jgi:hypothetical protein